MYNRTVVRKVAKEKAGEGFAIPPDALFTVSNQDVKKMMQNAYTRWAAEKAVVRDRILSLVRRDDPPRNLQQIVLYAMERGYL